MPKKARQVGENRGKRTTRRDLLVFFLRQQEPVLTKDVFAYCQKALNIGERKGIYNQLVALATEGLLIQNPNKREHPEKIGLPSYWHIPRNYAIAKRVYQEVDAIEELPKTDILRTEYIKNVISDDFLADAIIDFLTTAAKRLSSDASPRTRKTLRDILEWLDDGTMKREYLIGVFIGEQREAEVKEFLKSSPQALKFMLNPPEQKEFWDIIVGFCFAHAKILFELERRVHVNKSLPVEELERQVKQLEHDLKELVARKAPLYQAVQALFLADLFSWNLLVTPFVKDYLAKYIRQEAP